MYFEIKIFQKNAQEILRLLESTPDNCFTISEVEIWTKAFAECVFNFDAKISSPAKLLQGIDDIVKIIDCTISDECLHALSEAVSTITKALSKQLVGRHIE